jgi:hypothetical protein
MGRAKRHPPLDEVLDDIVDQRKVFHVVSYQSSCSAQSPQRRQTVQRQR